MLSAIFTASSKMPENNIAPGDTVIVIEKAGEVTVTRSPDKTTRVTVNGKNDDPDFFYEFSSRLIPGNNFHDTSWTPSLPFLRESKSPKAFRSIMFGNTYFGAAIPVDCENGMRGSVELGISDLFGVSYTPADRGFSVSIGAGFGYRLLTLAKGKILNCEKQRLSIIQADPSVTDTKSRIRSFSIHVPLMLTQKIYRTFGISAGAIVNFNTYTTATTSYTTDNTTRKETFKGLHQRFLTVDFMAAIGSVGNAGLYLKYSPMQLFEKGYGPRFNCISTGITFGF